MNLNDYIESLQKLREELGGDCRVVASAPYAPAGAVRDAVPPTVQTLQVKKPRESYEKVFSSTVATFSNIEDSGVKVVVL